MKKSWLFVLVFVIVFSSFVVSAVNGNGVCEDGDNCNDADCNSLYTKVCDGELVCISSEGGGICTAWEFEPEYFRSGLPECFIPVAGYSHNANGEGEEIISLWNKNGEAYVWPAGEGSFRRYFGNERAAQGVPSDFVIGVGYYHTINGESNGVISIWDGGNVYIYDGNPGLNEPFFRPFNDQEKDDAGLLDVTAYGTGGVVPFEGYYNEEREEVYLWVEDGAGGFQVFMGDSGGTFSEVSIDLKNGERPEVVYYESEGGKTVAWLDVPAGPEVWQSDNGRVFYEVTSTYTMGLPGGFIPTVGYTHNQNVDEITSLWNAEGDVWVRIGGSADFVEFTDEEKERYGLPVDFIPQEGYTNNLNPLRETIALVDASGEIYISAYGGGGFRRFLDSEKEAFGISRNFRPILGYAHNQHPNGEITSLWDGEGRNFFLAPGEDTFQAFTSQDKEDWNLGGFKPIVGYSHTFNGPENEIVSLWDVGGNNMIVAEGDSEFREFTEEEKEAVGLGGFKAILGYTNFLNGDGNEIISLWDANGSVKIIVEGTTEFIDYDENLDSDQDGISDREEQGLKDFNAVEGYYSAALNKVFLWDSAGILAVWNNLEEKFMMTQVNEACIPPTPGEKGISCENRGSAELCNEYGAGETLPEELLRSIEGFNEAFADANEIDYDFCSNPGEDVVISCYCEWTVECTSVVSMDGNACRIVITSEENIENVCGSGDEYFLTWDGIYKDGTEDGEAVGCVGGSRTFQCPSKIELPFFDLFNVVITLMIVLVGYGIFWVDRKK